MIAIVDYGVGNTTAIANMLKKVGAQSIITNNKQELQDASKLILPGVGAFDAAMNELIRLDITGILHEKALKDKVPVLGICLGMQLMTKGSEEGKLPGFGWVPSSTYKFSSKQGLKVPHMKWSFVEAVRSSNLTTGMEPHSKFYFVHSYFVRTEAEEHSVLQAEYGVKFDAAIQNGNIYGVQFHPEKSHKYGMKLLQNFAAL